MRPGLNEARPQAIWLSGEEHSRQREQAEHVLSDRSGFDLPKKQGQSAGVTRPARRVVGNEINSKFLFSTDYLVCSKKITIDLMSTR